MVCSVNSQQEGPWFEIRPGVFQCELFVPPFHRFTLKTPFLDPSIPCPCLRFNAKKYNTTWDRRGSSASYSMSVCVRCERAQRDDH